MLDLSLGLQTLPPMQSTLAISKIRGRWGGFETMEKWVASVMWNEALNKRLGTEGLDLPDVLVATDDWIYSDGKSTSCIAFILEMYKEGGLFDPVSTSIQVTEFTPFLPTWCNDNDDVKLPYCQILGKYRMELPDYNPMEPYPHMNEHCPKTKELLEQIY
ncbi:hypothetical protein DY000_02038523 [Brassica cretica]|uniref:Uncharacterized protein n=1 Tax=Brassica cretica TaxID=69181 RepID=A0ABQ7BEJ0_BRACR|nr:hypothetical protein DY000_02038523 [Brassica cretica]